MCRMCRGNFSGLPFASANLGRPKVLCWDYVGAAGYGRRGPFLIGKAIIGRFFGQEMSPNKFCRTKIIPPPFPIGEAIIGRFSNRK